MKRIAFLESNLSGSGFQSLKIAKDLGLHVTFITRDLDRYLLVPGGSHYFEQYVDEIRYCETNNVESVITELKEELESNYYSAFMTLGEYDVPVAAEIAKRYNFPGLNPEAAYTSRNKANTRRVCAEKGVPAPKFWTVETLEDILNVIDEVTFPCIVKPADETSSTDVIRCLNKEEVINHFKSIKSKRVNTRGQKRSQEILIEEFLIGYEVSVETITSKNNTYVLGVTDKLLSGNDHFVEVGHIFPSCLPEDVIKDCHNVVKLALDAIGFDFGVAHTELKITKDGPKLIEINARPAGDKIPDLVEYSLNLSSLKQLLLMSLGEEPDITNLVPYRGAAIRFLISPPGVITEYAGVELIDSLNGIQEYSIPNLKGRLVNPLTKNGERLGYVVATGRTAFEAARIAEAAVQQVSIKLKEEEKVII
ncbi:ATP-grasp domain-containing protein [Bacillus cereus]|uniref:ATP-grasp domain-containing protein n=1 Tax=Bacillus cereus TaxID=1396 RepID=UPI000BF96D12|nr:ATP-grasp domain-containing protein [Bacillus cereus]MDG1570404.1 ATP-grasp domain-containing protein [Bacillus cereus]PEX21403.1 biotin carboxylase [Bacillus cereus]PFT87841.1 biotin carboxylase [Bacillus cereus]PGO94837.1 biotin carboxylase [Bacillus cereus]